MLRTVQSVYRKGAVLIDDNCGCESGGFIEKEVTQHGFTGASWVLSVKIYCDKCGKELPQPVEDKSKAAE